VAAGVATWAQTSPHTHGTPTPQSAKEVRGASPYLEIKNEPPAKLIVDPPLPDLLDRGVVWIQWRAENVNIVPVVDDNHEVFPGQSRTVTFTVPQAASQPR
jgi:hypothetical protein